MTRRHRQRSRFFITLATLVTGSAGLFTSLMVVPEMIQPTEYTVGGTVLPAGPADVVMPLPPARPKHLSKPTPLRGIYMSSWIAATPSLRERSIRLAEETEVNAIMIDVKDYTGRISFTTDEPTLQATGAPINRITDIRDLIDELHSKDIFVIGRIAVFQDAYLPKQRPDLAVKRESNGAIWADKKGMTWLDPGSREVWDYTVAIARESERLGFDELNFDYIRFPSDGDMKDIHYPFFSKLGITRAENMKNFYAYLDEQLTDLEVPISADFFGLTTTSLDDLGIGQVLEDGLKYFDYIAPMVYPSHYPTNYLGYKNPAEHPYEVIKDAMDTAVRRAVAIGEPKEKIRPWLQDFNLGATYTPEMIRKEKQAVYDAGLEDWLMWDPSNKYTREALDNE